MGAVTAAACSSGDNARAVVHGPRCTLGQTLAPARPRPRPLDSRSRWPAACLAVARRLGVAPARSARPALGATAPPWHLCKKAPAALSALRRLRHSAGSKPATLPGGQSLARFEDLRWTTCFEILDPPLRNQTGWKTTSESAIHPAGVPLSRRLPPARPMATPLVAIVRLAAASRVLVLILSLLARLLFRPYDTSASLHPPCLSSPSFTPSTSSSNSTTAAISSLAVWDGVHFARAAECGYEYEQSFAFLPLLPASIALLSRSLFAPLVPMLGYRAVLVISGHVLNNVAFVAAAAYFYRLSVLILKDSGAAYRASVLFCFNPASVFYSSLYSESLYALFSLGGLFYLFSSARTIAMIMLALSGSARSNGALNAGYICFEALLQAYDAAVQKKRPMWAVQALVTGFLRSTFIFVPFFAFQAYGYLNICLHGDTDELRPWCKAKLPLLYSFIQSHYWGVGFLRYFQVKQLPNFLLASPVLSLAVYSILHYTKLLRRLFQSTSIHEQITATVEGRLAEACESSDVATVLKSEFSTGLNNNKQGNTELRKRKSVATKAASASSDDNISTGRMVGDNEDECPLLVLPFILHLAFMTFTAFFVMHVQVSTRFLSASPPIYWAASRILAPARGGSCNRWGYFIIVYFIAYILLGSLLFPNFYPFT